MTKKPDPINPINIPATCLLLIINLKKNNPIKSVARGVNEFKIAVTPLSISVWANANKNDGKKDPIYPVRIIHFHLFFGTSLIVE